MDVDSHSCANVFLLLSFHLKHVIDDNQRSLLSSMFLRIPPDSKWKVRISWNSMEFLWKAFGWSLSHLGFHFHGNSHFFLRNSDGNGQNPGASGNDSWWNPMDSIGIPPKFRWNSIGNSIIVIVKNSTTTRNWTLTSVRHHVSNQVGILTAALYDR